MEWLYPTRFTDKRGTEETTVRNDNTNLSITLRGVQFSGLDFDMLEASADTPKESLTKFALSPFRCLCECVLDVEIETSVLLGDEERNGVLTGHLELGAPIASGGLDRESLRLSLRVNSEEYSSDGATGFFELELLSLLRRMPTSIRPKICFTCAYSDYHPIGHGLFGGMFPQLQA
jgi:hypothetical protein